jgi:hypothetical protein
VPSELASPELVWTAAAAALALLMAVLLWARKPPAVRSLREKVGDAAGGARDQDIDLALNWLPPECLGDRRRAARRGGGPTPIRVSDLPQGGRRAGDEGLVLDRSTGGLCFAAHRSFREGTWVYVRAVSAPPGSPWVGVMVRHCRGHGDHFLIGCQFLDPPPWNVLLLFG